MRDTCMHGRDIGLGRKKGKHAVHLPSLPLLRRDQVSTHTHTYTIQVGASWAGAPVGFVAQHWGWGAIRHMWAASLLASAGFLSVPGLLVQVRVRVCVCA